MKRPDQAALGLSHSGAEGCTGKLEFDWFFSAIGVFMTCDPGDRAGFVPPDSSRLKHRILEIAETIGWEYCNSTPCLELTVVGSDLPFGVRAVAPDETFQCVAAEVLQCALLGMEETTAIGKMAPLGYPVLRQRAAELRRRYSSKLSLHRLSR